MDVPDELELKLLGHYTRQRRHDTPDFDVTEFARSYAIMGAQRATKILGIFARLDRRGETEFYQALLLIRQGPEPSEVLQLLEKAKRNRSC